MDYIHRIVNDLDYELYECEQYSDEGELTHYAPLNAEPIILDIEKRIAFITNKLIPHTTNKRKLICLKLEIRMLQELRSCVEDAEQDILGLSEPTE